MAHFENERQRGRAGTGPIVANNNDVGRVVGLGRGLPHGRVPILNARMPEPGGVSSWRGRGRGLSLHPPHLDLWAEDFPSHPHPFHPFPLKIVPHLGGTRRPLLDNHTLCPIVCNPMVISQSHPYAVHDPNAPTL